MRSHLDGAPQLPPKIEHALKRLPTIPTGMKEGEVFDYLGLVKPDEPTLKEVSAAFKETATQYNIGFGELFVLHCEAINEGLPIMKPTFRYDDGVLARVRILRLVDRGRNGEKKYELIPPEWISK